MTGNPRRRIPYPLPAYGRKCADTEPVKLANTAPAVEASFTEMCIRDRYTASSVKKEKPSVRKKLEVIKKRKPLHRERVRQKTRERPSTL